MTVIESPGIYELDEATYHADRNLAPTLGRSLSSSGAKALLDCPARFAYQREHPVVKDAFDFGHVAHARLLGFGDEGVVVVVSVSALTALTTRGVFVAKLAGTISCPIAKPSATNEPDARV